jgi:hypothetical protein
MLEDQASNIAAVVVRYWHFSDIPPWSLYVRCWGQSGKHILPLSISAFDPERKSGRSGQPLDFDPFSRAARHKSARL